MMLFLPTLRYRFELSQNFKDGHVIVVSDERHKALLVTPIIERDESLEGGTGFRGVIPHSAVGKILHEEDPVAASVRIRGAKVQQMLHHFSLVQIRGCLHEDVHIFELCVPSASSLLVAADVAHFRSICKRQMSLK